MARNTVPLLALISALCAWPVFAAAQTITFGDAEPGSVPKAFEFALTGKGQPGRWEIVRDDTATQGKALAQTNGDRTDYRFPLAVYGATTAANIETTVRFKTVSGSVDQAAGVVVRFIDANNYYVARANALEDNVRFYRVVRGDRQQLAGANVKVAANQWHSLALRAQGDQFTILYDGSPLLNATDKTFQSPGKAGVWTKADSITNFDRIEIKPLP